MYRVPRPMRKVGAIIPLTVQHDIALTADVALGFAFDTGNYYYNGVQAAIAGASDIHAIYDNMRVMKVEITILPAADTLDLNNQTITTGATNIPWLYTAIDYNDASAPTLGTIQQLGTCQTHLWNKVVRRTLYPRIEGSNGVIDASTNYKNQFMRSGIVSSQRWNGFKLYLDMKSQVWTYGSGRISLKVFYECLHTK